MRTCTRGGRHTNDDDLLGPRWRRGHNAAGLTRTTPRAEAVAGIDLHRTRDQVNLPFIGRSILACLLAVAERGGGVREGDEGEMAAGGRVPALLPSHRGQAAKEGETRELYTAIVWENYKGLQDFKALRTPQVIQRKTVGFFIGH